jgi:hypothetical protein
MDRLSEEKGKRDDKDVPKTAREFLKVGISFFHFVWKPREADLFA